MVMWGVGKDEMKGKHVLLTTYIYIYKDIIYIQIHIQTFISTILHFFKNLLKLSPSEVKTDLPN